MTLHSFVVLAYRESPFLRECVKSLEDQTAASSIIISTSTPCDSLKDLCSELRIPLRVNEAASGLAGDWNFGLQQASTKYVTLAHQDDLYDKRYTEVMVMRAEERSDNLITFSDYGELIHGDPQFTTVNLRIKRALRCVSYLRQKHISSLARKKLLLAFGSPIPCPSVMYNRDRLGDFQFSRDFSINADWDAWLRIACNKGAISYVNEPLLLHRIHDSSETSRGIGDSRRATEDLRLFKTIWPAPVAHLIARLYQLSYLGNSSGESSKAMSNQS